MKTVCGEKMDLSPGMVSFVCVPSTWPGLRRKGVYTAGVSDTYAEEKKAGEKKASYQIIASCKDERKENLIAFCVACPCGGAC